MTQKEIIKLILKSEGGLNTQEPESVGGVSYSGITQRTYESYLPRICEIYSDAPDRVRYLENHPDIVEKFYELYLGDGGAWLLPEFLQYMYCDFWTNAGAAAVKIIQQLAGCDADGVFGSGTKAAVTAWTEKVERDLKNDTSIDNHLIVEFHKAKLAHYQRLVDKNPDKFGKWLEGWKRRANHVLSELSEYFETSEGTPSAMDDADVPALKAELKPRSEWGTKPRLSERLEEKVLDLQRQVNDLEVRLTKLETARKFKE